MTVHRANNVGMRAGKLPHYSCCVGLREHTSQMNRGRAPGLHAASVTNEPSSVEYQTPPPANGRVDTYGAASRGFLLLGAQDRRVRLQAVLRLDPGTAPVPSRSRDEAQHEFVAGGTKNCPKETGARA